MVNCENPHGKTAGKLSGIWVRLSYLYVSPDFVPGKESVQISTFFLIRNLLTAKTLSVLFWEIRAVRFL